LDDEEVVFGFGARTALTGVEALKQLMKIAAGTVSVASFASSYRITSKLRLMPVVRDSLSSVREMKAEPEVMDELAYTAVC
jgi:hypothetical protein